ncbi:hypothetical protein HD806DRAFT_545050 [Xylariaceae sp. AK1471]|nr:hypothetical protein HD806DRAFT_545050 [Xylariaceae sp. AK1471]
MKYSSFIFFAALVTATPIPSPSDVDVFTSYGVGKRVSQEPPKHKRVDADTATTYFGAPQQIKSDNQ